jgi:hypothetical protein
MAKEGWILMTHPQTGMQFYAQAPKKGAEVKLRIDVAGLKAYEAPGNMIKFEWAVPSCDEPEAIDAQCRAGWNDQGYGFYDFKFENGVAIWYCGNSCD